MATPTTTPAAATNNPNTYTPYPNPNPKPAICFPPLAPPKPFFFFFQRKQIPSWSVPRRTLHRAKCSSADDPKDGFKGALSDMVGKQVEELLMKEENRALLDRLEKASERVEKARRELEEVEQLKDYVSLLQDRESEIAESQSEILEARAMIEEAERSLSLSADEGRNALESDEINRESERWESVKAACISAIVGTLAGFPLYASQGTSNVQLLLPSVVTFISCALFGVTFRYAVRRDLDNIQLKTGTSAAFGFVKGLGTLAGGPSLELNPGSFFPQSIDGALLVAENLLVFAFAAVSLDFCFRTGLLSPFPINKSDSQ